MKEEKGTNNLGRVEPRSAQFELSGPLYLEHEISTVNVLHHKEQSILQIVEHYSLTWTREVEISNTWANILNW